MTVGKPHKSQKQRFVLWQSLIESVLTQTVSLTHLPLHTITIHGVMKTLLRNTHEHLYRFFTILTLTQKTDHPQRKGSQRTTRRLSKEHFYQSQAEQTLPLTKRGANTFHLIEYIGLIFLQ